MAISGYRGTRLNIEDVRLDMDAARLTMETIKPNVLLAQYYQYRLNES